MILHPELIQKVLRSLTAVLLGLGATAGHAADMRTGIIVNSVALTAETVRQLQQIYPVPIRPGRYWYDPVSGAYGLEGGPIAGQMLPGLRLGGPLRANASRGTSGKNPTSKGCAGRRSSPRAIGSTRTESAASKADHRASISRCAGRAAGRVAAGVRVPEPSAIPTAPVPHRGCGVRF